MRNFLKNTSAYEQDENGQVAMFFAMMAVPLLAITSASVDYTNVVREKGAINGALDAAVIAAVNNNAIPLSDKGAYAETHFQSNYKGGVTLELFPTVAENQVTLLADGSIDLSFGQLIGIKDPLVKARSSAVISTENTICLMALNQTSAQSISFNGGIKYSSPSCSVQSNSSSSSAIVSVASLPPVAKSFCTVGGAYGDFDPYVKGECKAIDDPYESTALPTIPDTCVVPLRDLVILKDTAQLSTLDARELFRLRLSSAYDVFEQTGSLRAAVEDFVTSGTTPIFDQDANRVIELSQNLTGSFVDIRPGTFCGGLTVDGIDVDFLPGEYIIKDGPLSFINGAEAVAKDVTFILAGEGAVLNIQSQAQVELKARNSGARKGLAVMEAVDKTAPGNRLSVQQQSLVSGGGSLSVLGTIYLPTQKLEIRGEGTSVGSMAPATSFIADTLHIDGQVGATMVVDVDHKTAGIPPLLPRAEDGARLVE